MPRTPCSRKATVNPDAACIVLHYFHMYTVIGTYVPSTWFAILCAGVMALCCARGTASCCRYSTTLLQTGPVLKIEKRQLWVRPMGGSNSTLQSAWYIRHAHWARLCYIPFWYGVCTLNLRYCCDTQFQKFYGRPFARSMFFFSSSKISVLFCTPIWGYLMRTPSLFGLGEQVPPDPNPL